MNKGLSQNMTIQERRATLSLGAIYAVRMLGLFMILPIFALYAETLKGVTPFLVGIAIGIYGLTQALFQIPLGMLSDHIGRKPVIVGGLIVFALGSVIAALSDSISGVIMGRALQGAGAIAAAVMALAADLTREEQRTKVMAVIGLSIGMSFALALVLGPILEHWLGVPGIFWLTAVFALFAIAVTVGVVPQPVRTKLQRDAQVVRSAMLTVLRNPQLLRLDFGIFVLHLVLTANFIVIPVLLRDHIGMLVEHHWMLYLPVLLLSFVMMLPFIIVAEKYRRLKAVLVGAIALLAVAEFSFSYAAQSLTTMAITLLFFFVAFNFLEASMPSLVTKISSPEIKGTSMGVFSSSQFLGAFAGGASGGLLLELAGSSGIFIGNAILILLWLVVGLTMSQPRYLSSYLLNVGKLNAEHARSMVEQLTEIRGVAEAVIIPEDGMAYLKVDRKALDEKRLREFSTSPA